ncbi:MAG: hypothetical protein HOY75_08570 [Streptomyces sp.]|nr:hypothetical protein [Streptomyces sp.]
MALTADVQAWLLGQLGKTTDLADLNTRYLRLGTARAVALEVLQERLADLRAQPSTVNVVGVVGVSYGENIKAYERQIANLQNGLPPAPDDPEDTSDSDDTFGLIYFTAMERR